MSIVDRALGTLPETIDLVFSFDTTGSMRPAIGQVRRRVEETVKFLFSQIPNLRVGIIAHGDYCDGANTIKTLDLTNDVTAICRFIRNAPDTGGGDSDECYELVFHDARDLSWTSGKQKALVIIADAEPHEKGDRSGGTVVKYDWKNELGLLVEAGIKVFPVQALSHYGSRKFYDAIADYAGTPRIELEQFEDVTDLIMALCFQQAGRLPEFEMRLNARSSGVSQGIQQAISSLSGRTFKRKRAKVAGDFRPVEPSRFQIITIERGDTDPHDDNRVQINDFVRAQGLPFKVGRGFYEFTVPVKVQDYKEVIVQDRETGDMFTGDEARRILGIPTGKYGKAVTVRPDTNPRWRGFIQSTSATRKLHAGTKFLYEASRF